VEPTGPVQPPAPELLQEVVRAAQDDGY
jgi:hypothetical protein